MGSYIQTDRHPGSHDIGKLVSFINERRRDFHVYTVKELIGHSIRDFVLEPDLVDYTFDYRKLVLTIEIFTPEKTNG